jgi:hypothetical protein
MSDGNETTRGLRLAPADDPRRATPKPLGWANDGPRELIGLTVTDARMHLHPLGPTGVGKSTFQLNYLIAEATAGRGVALFDPQGDLAHNTLERLPADTGQRLVIIDPTETDAPPAWNPLQPTRDNPPELAAENVVGVFRRLYASFWGPRMDDTLRAACLTLAHRPGSSLTHIIPLLTNTTFRDHVLADRPPPLGLEGFWDDWADLSPGARHQACGPVIARLRAIFTRPFARDLLGSAQSTFALTDILDGAILIARLPKGSLGEDTTRLIGSLLLAGLWQATTTRAQRPPDDRPDATIIVDECHNFLHLPIGIADALAESRGYRVSWMLAHQHLGQLTRELRTALDANARNKIYFTLSPDDAKHLAHHVEPYLTATDLARRPAYQITCRIINNGKPEPPFTLDTTPPPPPIPGRAHHLRTTARHHTGLARHTRHQTNAHEQITPSHDAGHLRDPQPSPDPTTSPTNRSATNEPGEPARPWPPQHRSQQPGRYPGQLVVQLPGQPGGHLDRTTERPTPQQHLAQRSMRKQDR